MLNSGDIVDLDLGPPQGREAGFRHPAVVVSAQRILSAEPSVVHVVPLTSTLREFHSEITIEPDDHNVLPYGPRRSANTCAPYQPGVSFHLEATSGPRRSLRSGRRSQSCSTSLSDLDEHPQRIHQGRHTPIPTKYAGPTYPGPLGEVTQMRYPHS